MFCIMNPNTSNQDIDKTREKDLVIPALRAIYKYGDKDGFLLTSVLSKVLRQNIPVRRLDSVILKGRKDDRLSQVIRNLISHRTLEKKGLATYVLDQESGQAGYQLTKIGQEVLIEDAKSGRLSLESEGQLQLPFRQS